MNNNFSLKFKKMDIIVIIVSLIAIVSVFLGVYLYNKNQEGDRYLNVYHQNEKIQELYINIDEIGQTQKFVLKKEKYPHLLNDFYIEVDNEKGIRTIDIDCPDKDCEKMGWVNLPNLEIICVPNDVRMYISVNSSSGGDIII